MLGSQEAIGFVSGRQAHLIPASDRRAAAGLAVPLIGAEIPGAHRYPVESVICGGWIRCTVVTIQKCHGRVSGCLAVWTVPEPGSWGCAIH